MTAPDRIALTYNGAEAVEDFGEIGKLLLPHVDLDYDDLLDAMALYITKFGVFPARRLDTDERISLQPVARMGHALIIRCFEGEPFEAPYTVADEPKPRTIQATDIHFQLQLATASLESV